jgi:predicted TIM-barrel fold metal-dependent hydrolase
LYQDNIFVIADRITPHKIILGTDYPLIGQEQFLRRIRESGLAVASLKAILGGNAAQLLGPTRP